MSTIAIIVCIREMFEDGLSANIEHLENFPLKFVIIIITFTEAFVQNYNQYHIFCTNYYN